VPERAISSGTVVARAARTLAEPVLGDLVVLDPATDRYVRLNSTAAALWEAIEAPTPVSELARIMADRFHIEDERALADTTTFVRELAERELVVLDGA
jgi:Coenzyme PQQ synthesis protein D (PqqD)